MGSFSRKHSFPVCLMQPVATPSIAPAALATAAAAGGGVDRWQRRLGVPFGLRFGRRRERLLRLRDGCMVRLAGGDRREQPCVSSHPRQRVVVVPYGWGACDPEQRRADGVGRGTCTLTVHRTRVRGATTC